MFTSKNLSWAVRVGLGLVIAAPAAVAQQAEEQLVEEVMVTGSRIARDPLSTTGPITLVDAEQIEQSGVSSIEDLLTKMPSVGTNGIGKNDNNGGAGLAWVDLRNLGVSRTLVLVNGRRFVSSTSGVASAVDLGNIPVSMIERIEVLTDGASAVYGSDAVAGVINIVMKNDFEGVEVAAKLGDSIDGGGDSQDLSVTFGTVSNQYSITGNISYSGRGELGYEDRDWAGYNSIYHPQGNLYIGGLGSVYFDEADNAYWNESFDLQDMWLAGSSERTSLTLNGNYFFTDVTELYVETTYTNRQSNQQLAGNPIWLNVPLSSISDEQSQQIQDEWDDAGYDGSWESEYYGVYSRAAQNREMEQDGDTYRLLTGFKGEFDNGWGWDAYGSYGYNEVTEYTYNSINKTQLDEAVANGANVVGGWDDEARTAAYYTDIGDNNYAIVNFGAAISGDLGELQGGSIGFAAGAEYRKESAEFNPSPETVSGDSAGNQQSPTDGSFSVSEVFAEVNLPILSGVKGAEELSIDAAVRYSDFSSFGGQGTYRLGGLYAPISELTLRASYSTSYRAPNVYELYRGASESYLFLDDPCAETNSAQCQEEGLDDSYEHTSGQIPTNIGGYEGLEPEEAETLTIGAVWMPEYIEDFSVTLDYYDIKIENSIGAPDFQYMLDLCYLDGDADACDYLAVERNETTGQIEYMNGTLQNLGFEHVEGIDLEILKTLYFSAGELGLSAQGSYLMTYDVEQQDGSTYDYVGEVGNSGGIYTPWRGLIRGTWYSANDWTLGATIQYYDDGVSGYGKEMDAVAYLNLNGSYLFNENLELTAGVDNVLNEEPQFTYDYNDGYGELNSTYDQLGTFVWMGVKATF